MNDAEKAVVAEGALGMIARCTYGAEPGTAAAEAHRIALDALRKLRAER